MEPWLRHPTEDALEEYALKRLGEADTAPLEEHLLLCEPCQVKLQGIDDFILAMKQAEPALSQLRDPWLTRLPWTRLRWIGLWGWLSVTPGRAILAGVALLCVGGLIEQWPLFPERHPVQVTLTALRGGEPGFTATAPAGHPLALDMEVPDIASCPQCRVAIVDDSGRTAWSGSASVSAGHLSVIAPVALESGVYWVRLYIGAGTDPAREFGLRLK